MKRGTIEAKKDEADVEEWVFKDNKAIQYTDAKTTQSQQASRTSKIDAMEWMKIKGCGSSPLAVTGANDQLQVFLSGHNVKGTKKTPLALGDDVVSAEEGGEADPAPQSHADKLLDKATIISTKGKGIPTRLADMAKVANAMKAHVEVAWLDAGKLNANDEKQLGQDQKKHVEAISAAVISLKKCISQKSTAKQAKRVLISAAVEMKKVTGSLKLLENAQK